MLWNLRGKHQELELNNASFKRERLLHKNNKSCSTHSQNFFSFSFLFCLGAGIGCTCGQVSVSPWNFIKAPTYVYFYHFIPFLAKHVLGPITSPNPTPKQSCWLHLSTYKDGSRRKGECGGKCPPKFHDLYLHNFSLPTPFLPRTPSCMLDIVSC